MPFFAGRWRAESTSFWGPFLLIWTVYLQGSVHNCHPVTPLSCPWEGSLYLASVMDPLRPGSHVFFHGFLPYFSWEHPLETYMSAHNFVLLSQMFSCLIRFRCLRWKSGFCRVFERTAPNFGASSVAIEKSDVILILDPLNLNLKKKSLWKLFNLFFAPADLNFIDVPYSEFSSNPFVTTFNLETPAFQFEEIFLKIFYKNNFLPPVLSLLFFF